MNTDSKTDCPRILVLSGPTSSGKTGLSLRVAEAFDGEVINADARQIYRDFTIGTGKPPGEQGVYQGESTYFVRSCDTPDCPRIPHYLMDCVDPKAVFTVAEWRRLVLEHIYRITDRGHLPIIVGGTGLYLRSLTENFSIPSVSPDIELRRELEGLSRDVLVRRLLDLDPDAEAVVDLKNPRRIIRAIELFKHTGKPIRALKVKKPACVQAFQVALQWSREKLNARIDQSVDRMIQAGWIEEVRRLHDQGVPWDAPAMTSIGYREISAYLQRSETLSSEDISALSDRIKTVTHQYAKRQMTWFGRDQDLHWVLDAEEGFRLIRLWIESGV